MDLSYSSLLYQLHFFHLYHSEDIYEEMIYKNQYILNSEEMANGNITELKAVNDDFEFFGQYFIALTMMMFNIS
jgi:hypothetical protein